MKVPHSHHHLGLNGDHSTGYVMENVGIYQSQDCVWELAYQNSTPKLTSTSSKSGLKDNTSGSSLNSLKAILESYSGFLFSSVENAPT